MYDSVRSVRVPKWFPVSPGRAVRFAGWRGMMDAVANIGEPVREGEWPEFDPADLPPVEEPATPEPDPAPA